ncbi:MAG TPA: glycosyltransferase 87 family protein [Terriglobales bacterium]
MAAINEVSISRRIAVVLSILAASGMAYYYLAILLPNTLATPAHPTIGRHPFGSDFYQVWFTSRECLPQRLDPYSLTVAHKIQAGVFGHELSSSNPDRRPEEYRAFAYPAFADVIGLPVAWLQYSTARIVLVITLVLLTSASVLLWAKGLGWSPGFSVLIVFVGLTLSSYQGLEALYALQPGLIVAFLLSAAIAALAANKLRLAGFLLAFSTIKPQVSALLILYLLLWSMGNWQERRKLALAFLTTLAVLCAAATLVWPTWILGWQKAIAKYPGYYSGPPLLDMFGTYFGSLLLVVILAVTIAFAWNNRHEEPTSFRFALTVSFLLAITTITIVPEHAVYDHVILLPGIMMGARSWQVIWQRNLVARGIFALAVGALLWQWMAAPVVLLVHAIAPHTQSALLFFPLRTAAAIPFVAVSVLCLMIWQRKAKQHLVAVANRFKS